MTTEIDDARTTTSDHDLGDTERAGRSGPTRTARLGLLLMALGPLVAALGDPSVLVFAAPLVVVPAIALVLVSRYGRWAHGLTSVIGLAGLAIGVPGTWVFIDAPDSFFDVVPTSMFILGGLLAVLGGLSGAVARWRDAGLWWARATGLGLLAAVAFGSGVVAATTSSDVDPEALAAATPVSVDDRGFDPEELALTPGTSVTLALRNDGRIAHTFTSEALDVDVVLSPGEVALVDVAVPDRVAGLQYWCVPHSQTTDDGRREWMVGELVAAG